LHLSSKLKKMAGLNPMAASPIILIPARMASTRLPNKPLADICGLPMIVQVLRRAEEAGIGRVVVAAAEQEVVDVVVAAGGEAVLTDPDLPSGSDRIYEALKAVDPDAEHDVILNVQGDLPTLDPAIIAVALKVLEKTPADISTLVTEIDDESERANPDVPRAILALPPGARVGKALYFTRGAAPYGQGPDYHHIGLYGYRREALARFVSLSPSPLEEREKLEQLRALEAGMRIDAALVDTVPLGVDTPADLERARLALANKT
jgi:3-deoxy-manno-octulosonate cytidylyltransferase (CMP-KDO synthetase)